MPAPHDRTDATIRVRAWGIDDPRVIPPLSYENQAGASRRRAAIGDRAHQAGWPDDLDTSVAVMRNRNWARAQAKHRRLQEAANG